MIFLSLRISDNHSIKILYTTSYNTRTDTYRKNATNIPNNLRISFDIDSHSKHPPFESGAKYFDLSSL